MVQQELMTQQRYSQQLMIEKLQEMAARLGRSPTQVEASTDPDIPSHMTYVKRFGSWTAALRAAGLPVDPHSVGYDCETLLERTISPGDLDEQKSSVVSVYRQLCP